MVDIIRLHTDPHRQVQELLPWCATGALEPEDAAVVEAHLATCAECRAELEAERSLAAGVVALPVEVDRGWAALSARLEPVPELEPTALRRSAPRLPSARRSDPRPGGLMRKSVPMRWAVAAQAAGVVLTAGLVFLSMNRMQPQPQPQGQLHAAAQYSTLSSATARPVGNVVVIFKPTVSERDFRGSLVRAGARVVDGPTASDAYVLRVAPDRRGAALAALRADRGVVLAEAIDGDPGS